MQSPQSEYGDAIPTLPSDSLHHVASVCVACSTYKKKGMRRVNEERQRKCAYFLAFAFVFLDNVPVGEGVAVVVVDGGVMEVDAGEAEHCCYCSLLLSKPLTVPHSRPIVDLLLSDEDMLSVGPGALRTHYDGTKTCWSPCLVEKERPFLFLIRRTKRNEQS